MRINIKNLDALDRQPTPAKLTYLWDDKLAGFGVRWSPKGKITYLLKFRIRGEAQQRMRTIGDWPAMPPDRAREIAEDHRSSAQQGRNLDAEAKISAERQEATAAETRRRAIPLSALLDGFRAELTTDLDRQIAEGRTGAYERELLRLERSVLRPALGEMTIGGFDTAIFQALVASQGSVSKARQLRNTIMRFIAHATTQLTLQGITVSWPDRLKVKGQPGKRWDRYSLDQMAAIWLACDSLGRRGALVRLLILTGARRSEAARLRRDDLALDDPNLGAHWIQRGQTTKNRKEHRVPLSPPAVAMLRWLPDRSTRTTPDTDLVFAGRGGKPISSFSDLARAMRAGAGISEGTLHDFRRTIVSALGDHGFDPQVADQLLNHSAAATLPGVMAVYQRSELWAKRVAAVTLWADLLFAAVDAKLGKPVSRETWGFEAPFAEARIKRPEKAQAAPTPAARPSPARRPRRPARAIAT